MGWKPGVLAIVGPTAVGKTDLAVGLCQRRAAEIVVADSRQVYKGLDIASNKPTAGQRAKARFHMIDVADPRIVYSAADYVRDATQAIAQIHGEGHLAIVEGGTGLYVDALLGGLALAGVEPCSRLRQDLAEVASTPDGLAQLWAELAAVDPDLAASIDANNPRRIIRAIEIWRSTGIPPSHLRTRTAPRSDVVWVGLTAARDSLYRRSDDRVALQLSLGVVAQAKEQLEAGVDPGAPAMTAVGCREPVQMLSGEIGAEDLVGAMRRGTRRFIRRQLIWSRRNPAVTWIDVTSLSTEGAIEVIDEFLPAMVSGTGQIGAR